MNATLKSYLTRAIRKGSLEIVDAEGNTFAFGDGRRETVRVRFTSAEAEAAVTRDPDLKLGETFADGTMIIEQGSIFDFLMVIFRNSRNALPPWRMIAITGWRLLTRRIRQINTPGRAKQNIHSHYDLDGRLYSLFLDADLQYSCAYWEDGVASLDDAQHAKKRHLAAKLNLKPGMRVLDIGSGWGGLGLYLAEHCGVEVVGVTLSEEQHAVSNRRAEERGLADKAKFLLQDYRKVEGPFDRIVSVGMFEHVGVGYYRAFFKACKKLLADNGSMVLHSIGRTDGPGDTSAWIHRYIFPGGYIPAVSEVIPAVEKAQLHVTDMEILRLHYAKTLRAWRERFLAHREEVKALYDERFCRIWEFYLAASEVAFETGLMMNFQIQLTKNQLALPLTRNYMFTNENALRTSDGDSQGPVEARRRIGGLGLDCHFSCEMHRRPDRGRRRQLLAGGRRATAARAGGDGRPPPGHEAGNHARFSVHMSSTLIAPSVSSESVAAAVTRPPALATLRTSTPSPRAAIETMVSHVATVAVGPSTAGGMAPAERSITSARKPTTNSGTIWPRLGRRPSACRRPSDSASTTGPSMSTRTSLTSVPTWTLRVATGAVAAMTCGTA